MFTCRVRYSPIASKSTVKALCRSASKISGKNSPQRHEILTLLHKTTALLPRALASRDHVNAATESLEFWKDILSGTYDNLLSKNSNVANVAVYGVNEWSGAHDLVTALLEEPLTYDESFNEQLRSRWETHSGQTSLTISSLPTPETSFHTPSSFLQQFPLPIQITELSSTTSPPSSKNHSLTEIDERIAQTLLRADIAIILCNPILTPIPTLLRNPLFTLNPNTILIVTSSPSDSAMNSMKASLLNPIPHRNPGVSESPRILFVDPSRAVAANKLFKSDSKTSEAIRRFQDEFIASRVSTVTAALKSLISPPLGSSEASLRAQTSLAHIQAALASCQASLKHAQTQMDTVAVDVCTLNARIEEAKVRAQIEVLSSPKSAKLKEEDIVANAVQAASKEVKVVMDRLTWWRMLWRVDEISLLVTQAVHQAWCRDLERQLILQSGRLAALQAEMTKALFALLAAHPSPPFKSAVLQNSLHQIANSPTFPLTPQTLTHPINTRRAQIIEYPTTRLHVAGQRAVLGMSGGVAAGAGIGWAGWYGWLMGSGEGLFGAVGLDAGTAIGVGLLGSVMGVRWAVGMWERSKRRWWEDWNRVGEGLGRDLRASLDQAMQNKVLIVAETGCHKLSELIVQRRMEIEELTEELDTLQTTLHTLQQQPK